MEQKLKKRYNKSRKYREELKQKRKQAFGGKLTKTPSPKSKSREEIKDQTSGNAVPAKKTTTKKKKKKKSCMLMTKMTVFQHRFSAVFWVWCVQLVLD